MVISVHTHALRVDEPDAGRAFHQVVGGGPRPESATLLRLSATSTKLTLASEDLAQRELGRWDRTPRR